MKERIDCKNPEQLGNRLLCRWCGRPCRWDYKGNFCHRRGYRRIHADPREAVKPKPKRRTAKQQPLKWKDKR